MLIVWMWNIAIFHAIIYVRPPSRVESMEYITMYRHKNGLSHIFEVRDRIVLQVYV